MNKITLLFLILFSLSLPCFAENDYKNVIALSGGFPELLDIEYQRSFGKFYLAFKPGLIVMLLWDYNDHQWPAYPSLRFGLDVFKYRNFKIGPQVEFGYMYVPDMNTIVAGDVEYYIKKTRSDNSFISFGPAVRYDWRRLEIQFCVGLTIENEIQYIEEKTNIGTNNSTVVLPAEVLPLIRISFGFAF
jgi:hypothetical protein